MHHVWDDFWFKHSFLLGEGYNQKVPGAKSEQSGCCFQPRVENWDDLSSERRERSKERTILNIFPEHIIHMYPVYIWLYMYIGYVSLIIYDYMYYMYSYSLNTFPSQFGHGATKWLSRAPIIIWLVVWNMSGTCVIFPYHLVIVIPTDGHS